MKNHFLMPYFGNKRQEVERIYEEIKEDLLNDEIKTIIEPYCGTSAMSYYISTLHPKRFNYILNDNNTKLIELYKIAKSKKKLKEFEKRVLSLITPYPSKEKYNEIVKCDTLEAWFIKNKFYNLRPGLYCPPDTSRCKGFLNMVKNQKIGLEECPVVNFLRTEKIILTSDDAINMIEKDLSKTDRYYLIDPPYMCSVNDYYDNHKDRNNHIYEYFFNKHKDIKFKYCFIVNKNWIMNLLFRDFNKVEYDKKYSSSNKKKVKHMIIKSPSSEV